MIASLSFSVPEIERGADRQRLDLGLAAHRVQQLDTGAQRGVVDRERNTRVRVEQLAEQRRVLAEHLVRSLLVRGVERRRGAERVRGLADVADAALDGRERRQVCVGRLRVQVVETVAEVGDRLVGRRGGFRCGLDRQVDLLVGADRTRAPGSCARSGGRRRCPRGRSRRSRGRPACARCSCRRPNHVPARRRGRRAR